MTEQFNKRLFKKLINLIHPSAIITAEGYLRIMKKYLFLFVFIPYILYSQTFGDRQIINDEFNFRKVIAADFDYDGITDIAAVRFNNVSWYKNTDGLGAFSSPNPIQLNQESSFDIITLDVNNNGFLDVVVSYFGNNFIAWYPNDGNGIFGSSISVVSGLNTVSAAPFDVNQNGLADLVIGITNSAGFYWAENPGNNSANWTLHTIDPNVGQARNALVTDINGNGAADIFIRVEGALLYWYENTDGLGQNWTPTLLASNIGSSSQLVDIDDDGLTDILTLSNSNQVLWLKNLDGTGAFSDPIVIHTETNNINYLRVTAFDVNNNGFMDVVASTGHVFIENNKLVWFENLDGQGSFGPPQVIDTHVQFISSIASADITGDGYKDIIVSIFGPDISGLYWYKNNSALNLPDYESSNIHIYPNPVSTDLNFHSNVSIDQIAIYTSLGQKVVTLENNIQSIDVSHFSKGLYFVEVIQGQSKSVLKFLKK